MTRSDWNFEMYGDRVALSPEAKKERERVLQKARDRIVAREARLWARRAKRKVPGAA